MLRDDDNDRIIIPSDHDRLSDANVSVSSLPADELDAAFGYGTEADDPTAEELDNLWIAEMERRDAEAAELAERLETRPITNKCVRLDPSKWERIA